MATVPPGAHLIIRECTSADSERIYSFVGTCPPLIQHTPFTYWVTLRYWGPLCLVAEDSSEIVAYISSIGVADDDDLMYVWQIGVASSRRGEGLGMVLLQDLVARARQRGYQRLQVSISRDNTASRGLFERLSASLGQSLRVVVPGDEPTLETRFHIDNE